MLSIGDFARAGRVSVRMLRHYDAIGLLTPARVDASTGYRSYTAGQLALLNRIVALKELGLTLAQVQQVVESAVTVDENPRDAHASPSRTRNPNPGRHRATGACTGAPTHHRK
ncbi:MerR family transcriptional regulator [Rhodococcus erythropolis]|uniref:MerR family transcriptional regulator n=1 Tax=Rhodococcus erythropolis TaxID=1833 RepID=UPI001E63E24E|nr:helix-turn-helix domain-containing protein [Rhodococcus erythropolis]